ncbi:hypothetical protein SNEBB_011215 [Seison nebaliae]|nr:hypothetical protein SNEBB_011215 [Seison nebaliae]
MLTTNTSSNSALQTLTSQILNVITKKPQNPETTGRTDQFTSNSISTQFPPEFTDSSVGYNPTSTNIVYSTNEETTDPTNVSSTTENLSVDENSFGSSLIKMLTTSISSNSALHTSASPIVHGTTKMPQNPETTGRTDQFTSNSISTQFPPQSTESSVSNNHNIVSVSSEFTTSTSQTKSPTTLIDESSTTVTSTTVKPVTEQTEITNPTFPKNYFTSTTDMIEKTQSQKFNCLQLSEIVYLNEDKCEALLLKKNFILTTTECYRQGQSNSISTGANQTPIQLSNNAHISQDRLLIAVRIESDNCFTAEHEPNIRYNFKYHNCESKPNNKHCSYLKFEDDRWKENITKGIVNRKHTDRFLGFTYGNREIVVFSSYKDGLIKTLLDQEIILKQSR